MQIDLSNVSGCVRNHIEQDFRDTYFVKLEFRNAGFFIDGLKVIIFHTYNEATGRYAVYRPSTAVQLRTGEKYISHIEWDTKSDFWNRVVELSLQAVEQHIGEPIERK